MLYPLVFQPIFKERIWGGRELERLFAKKIPAGQPIVYSCYRLFSPAFAQAIRARRDHWDIQTRLRRSEGDDGKAASPLANQDD